jgi:hypothetical protein
MAKLQGQVASEQTTEDGLTQNVQATQQMVEAYKYAWFLFALISKSLILRLHDTGALGKNMLCALFNSRSLNDTSVR